MKDATATYKFLPDRKVLICVSYPDGGFGMERISVPRNFSRYETAYSAANAKAERQGFRLGRFYEDPEE
jgi:hypothetical protein